MFKTKFRRKSRLIMALACAMLILQPTALGVSVAYSCCPPTGTLNVEADVGSIHFRGEMAEFYILVSYLGKPIDAEISAMLYYNGTLQVNMNASVQHVATGLYRVPYVIPIEASAGTYALVASASNCTLKGTTLKSFLLSATLTSWNARLIEIQGDLAIIKTDVGEIKVSLEAIEARLVSIEGGIVTITTVLGDINGTIVSIGENVANIKSDIGYIQMDISDIKLTLKSINGTMVTIQSKIGDIIVTLSQINATLNSLNGTVAIIETNIGMIETSIEDILLEITAIKGDIATIRTTLGDINGTIVSIEGDIANIKTDIGEVKASLPPAPTTTLGIPITLIFAIIAAIASTISAILLLRKRKANH